MESREDEEAQEELEDDGFFSVAMFTANQVPVDGVATGTP